MTGRGAWNVSGVGGTKGYRALGSTVPIKPGPYYYNGTGYLNPVTGSRDQNEYACFRAVAAYQARLNRENVPCAIDGLYGPQTVQAVVTFQKAWLASGDPKASVWGGIGPESSERLLKPLLLQTVANHPHDAKVTPTIVSGVIRSESGWDAGAVGYVDQNDVGLAQINAGAHPELSVYDRTEPVTSFEFVLDYLTKSLSLLSGNIRDSIASYNLGVGGKNSAGVLVGTRAWIADGRPDVWTPPYTNTPREVKVYIDHILAG